jgi:hypothetical protein
MGVLDPGLEQLRDDLVRELRATEARMRQHVDEAEARTRHHVDEAEARTRQHVDEVEARTRHHAEAMAGDSRRHFDVVAEGLLGKIELVAEGLATLDQRMERFRDEVQENFAKVDRRFLRLEARIFAGPAGP